LAEGKAGGILHTLNWVKVHLHVRTSSKSKMLRPADICT
jgi:hypothetical protein